MSRFSPFIRTVRWLCLLLPIALFGCLHGPKHYRIKIESQIVQPLSHTFAVAVDWSAVRARRGITTFPNGGLPHVIAHEARIYRVNVNTNTIEMIARLEDYGGIAAPQSIELHQWHRDGIYFTIRGYGERAGGRGDDTKAPREVHFRVPKSGELIRLDQPPDQSALHNAPSEDKKWAHPGLYLRGTSEEIVIQIDDWSLEPERIAFLRFSKDTGAPYLIHKTFSSEDQ